MNKLLLFTILIYFYFGLSGFEAKAQNPENSIEQVITDIYEQYSEESETEVDFTNFYDDLMSLAENPINLNNTNQDELEKLQFLSDVQIDNILYYLYRNAPLQTIYELQLIDGLDMTDIQRMLHFVVLGKSASEKNKLIWKDVFKYGKNEVYLRFDKGLETREGYRLSLEEDSLENNSASSKYLGDPYYNSLKYRFRFKDRLQFGVTGEKDAGEQFWGKYNKGYDFYSAYLELKNTGNFKTIVLGDYRANFGQGLVMRTDFSMGKSSYVLQVNPRSNGLKKSSSTSEFGFLRGVGFTYKVGKIDFTAFYSNKRIDADTAGGYFTSIKEDGLHRTLNDWTKKNTVNQQVIGGNVLYTHYWFQLGATAVYTRFNQTLMPSDAVYNYFYFRGKEQFAASVNHRLRWEKLNFFGETAITDKKAVATIQGVDFNPVSRVSLVALYRYYSKEYDALFADAFGETSRINNESGFYIGAEIHPIKYWKISVYADSYRFPWSKFSIDVPSSGKDYLVQADFSPKRNVNMYWRLKYEQKYKNYTDTIATMAVVLPQSRWQLRYQLNYTFGAFDFRNQIDINAFKNEEMKSTYGFSIFQDVNYAFDKIPLILNGRLQLFDATNFENRIYVYEKDVLYAFSIPMNYGIGTRYYVNLKYAASRNVAIWLKFAQTIYADDRTEISSGNEMIQGNRKTDARILLQLKF